MFLTQPHSVQKLPRSIKAQNSPSTLLAHRRHTAKFVHKDLPNWAPDVVKFLEKYETTLDINNQFLAYMRDTDGKADEGAMWFLKTYESLWTTWVPVDVVKKVKAAMK